MELIIKRWILYISGVFFLSSGVSLSILADFGVSPVSALAYALSLVTGLSVGLMAFAANILYLILQDCLNKSVPWKEHAFQLILSVLFGLFINLTLAVLEFVLPPSPGLLLRVLYLICSLFVIAFGLFFLFSSKLPVLPYDGLTYAISRFFKWSVGKAKVNSDLVNVTVAAAICLSFLLQLGSIGLGTLVSAVFIGRILGLFMNTFGQGLAKWLVKIHREKPGQIFVDGQ